MPRTPGARSHGYDSKRAAMLEAIRRRLADRERGFASWRDLASAAGVSPSTLSHYFGGRDDVVRALMLHDGALGRVHREQMARPLLSFDDSIRTAAASIRQGMEMGVSTIIGVGLMESLSSARVAPVFLSRVLDPTIAAVAERLAGHIRAGQMRDVDPTVAALHLLSPLLVAALHQRELGGAKGRPIDSDRLEHEIAEAFIAGYRAGPADAGGEGREAGKSPRNVRVPGGARAGSAPNARSSKRSKK